MKKVDNNKINENNKRGASIIFIYRTHNRYIYR